MHLLNLKIKHFTLFHSLKDYGLIGILVFRFNETGIVVNDRLGIF